MTAEREKAINEWLRVHCPKCANNDFLNCQCECEVQKDVGITCIHYEEYVAENKEEKAKLCQESYIAGMEHNCEDVGNAEAIVEADTESGGEKENGDSN